MARNTAATVTYLLVCILGFSGRAESQVSAQTGSQIMVDSRQTALRANSGLTIKVDVSSVLLNTSVRDRMTNRSIGGLQADDFLVYEDGVLQQLQQAKITENPYNILLLIDVSDSTHSFMKLMKEAAINFLYEISERDTVAVASFNSKVRLVQDFTANIDMAAEAISHLRSDGGTAFYDALMTCVGQYVHRVDGRKAIVVFTDGVDNTLQGNPRGGSRTSFSELYARLHENDALIYTIFLNTKGKKFASSSRPADTTGGIRIPGIERLPSPWPIPTSSRAPFPMPFPLPSPIPKIEKIEKNPEKGNGYEIAYEQLEAIAKLTGGRMYSPSKVQELAGVYREIADDLRIQYLLSYASSNASQGDGWRSIRVEIKDHPEAVVRTRRGYAVSHNRD